MHRNTSAALALSIINLASDPCYFCYHVKASFACSWENRLICSCFEQFTLRPHLMLPCGRGEMNLKDFPECAQMFFVIRSIPRQDSPTQHNISQQMTWIVIGFEVAPRYRMMLVPGHSISLPAVKSEAWSLINLQAAGQNAQCEQHNSLIIHYIFLWIFCIMVSGLWQSSPPCLALLTSSSSCSWCSQYVSSRPTSVDTQYSGRLGSRSNSMSSQTRPEPLPLRYSSPQRISYLSSEEPMSPIYNTPYSIVHHNTTAQHTEKAPLIKVTQFFIFISCMLR